MTKGKTGDQKLGWAAFAAYLALLVYFMFFSEGFGRAAGRSEYSYNLVLFREIRRFIVYRRQLGMRAVLLNLAGNIAGFLPFGFCLPLLCRRVNRGCTVILLSALVSLAVELLQLILMVGSFDVDDLFLNTLGGALGYLSCRIFLRARKGNWKWRKEKRRSLI